MEYLALDDKVVGIELNWVLSQGWTVSELAGEYQAQAFVSVRSERSEVTGLVTALPKKIKRKTKIVALAALCAFHARRTQVSHAVYVLPLPEMGMGAEPSRFAVVGILDQIPAIGYDKIVKAASVASVIQHLQQDAQPEEVVVFNDQNILSQVLAAQSDQLKAAIIQPVPHSRAMPLLSVSVVLGVAAWFGWGQWEQYEIEQRVKAAVAQQLPPQQTYERALPGMFANAGWSFAGANTLLSTLATRPLERAGWEVSRIVCTVANGCNMTWSKTLPSATMAAFVAATGEAVRNKLVVALDRIDEPVAGITLPAPMDAIAMSDLQSERAFLVGAVSAWQHLSATGDLTLSMKAPMLFGTNDTTLPNPVWQGAVTISGALYLLPAILDVSGRHLSIPAIEITLGSTKTVKVDVNFYFTRGK